MKAELTLGSILIYLASLLCGACGGNPGGPIEEPDLCAIARELRAMIPGGASGFLTEEQEADIAARVLPGGFGGMFQDLRTGFLTFRLKDLTPKADAERALRRILTCGSVYPGWLNTIVNPAFLQVRQGQYTATELLSYLNALQPLRSDPEVWAVVVDPELNRIWIGVSNVAAQSRIQQVATGNSVPLGSLVIETPPPTTGSESFEILETPIDVQDAPQLLGVFGFTMQVRYTNRASVTRYPDQCVDVNLPTSQAYFAYALSKWDGARWERVFDPVCVAVLLLPGPVSPGEQQTDTIPVTGSYRLNSFPLWLSPRVTGTYRFEGRISQATTSSTFVAVPLEESISLPFRLIR